MKPIGIMAALPEEISSILIEMKSDRVHRFGMREFHEGFISGRPCIAVFSRVGKVSSAATAADLISRFDVGEILFTGVAGGIGSNVNVGDIVVGDSLLQHDLDASPLFPRYEVPLLGRTRFPTDDRARADLAGACRDFLRDPLPSDLREFGIEKPAVHEGLIASGDQFFSSQASVRDLRARLPETLCVEMEGAAVAQVCFEHGVPYSIIRTISDRADDSAHVDFPKFIAKVATLYAHEIVRRYFERRPTE